MFRIGSRGRLGNEGHVFSERRAVVWFFARGGEKGSSPQTAQGRGEGGKGPHGGVMESAPGLGASARCLVPTLCPVRAKGTAVR